MAVFFMWPHVVLSNICFQTSFAYDTNNFELMPASKLTLGVKNPTADAGDLREVGLMPGLGRSPGGGHGNPLQNACLEKPMDRGAWRATVHGVTKSWT